MLVFMFKAFYQSDHKKCLIFLVLCYTAQYSKTNYQKTTILTQPIYNNYLVCIQIGRLSLSALIFLNLTKINKKSFIRALAKDHISIFMRSCSQWSESGTKSISSLFSLTSNTSLTANLTSLLYFGDLIQIPFRKTYRLRIQLLDPED